LVCILLGYLIYDKSFNANHIENIPNGFEMTHEINIDPVS